MHIASELENRALMRMKELALYSLIESASLTGTIDDVPWHAMGTKGTLWNLTHAR